MDITTESVIKKLLVLFLFFGGLYFAKDFLMPLTTGGVLATLFLPFCKWMEKKKVPALLAVLICLLLLVAGALAISSIVGWQISGLAENSVLIKQRALSTIADVQVYISKHAGVSIEEQRKILRQQQPVIAQMARGLATSFTGVLSSSLLVLVYMIFLLFYRRHIKQFFLKLAPQNQRTEMNTVVDSVAKVSQQYLIGLLKMIVCLWIMYGIGFSALGVKNALFFAFLCGILEIVPFIGNITGTTITVLVAAAQGASPMLLAGIVITYGIIQFIQGWVLEPLIVGSQVKINPLFTIIALILGELLWGIPGIFLAIPLIAMFKIVCDNIESMKPYGFLIGETAADTKEPPFVRKIKSLKNS